MQSQHDRDGIFDDYTGPDKDGTYPCEHGETNCGCQKCAEKFLASPSSRPTARLPELPHGYQYAGEIRKPRQNELFVSQNVMNEALFGRRQIEPIDILCYKDGCTVLDRDYAPHRYIVKKI